MKISAQIKREPNRLLLLVAYGTVETPIKSSGGYPLGRLLLTRHATDTQHEIRGGGGGDCSNDDNDDDNDDYEERNACAQPGVNVPTDWSWSTGRDTDSRAMHIVVGGAAATRRVGGRAIRKKWCAERRLQRRLRRRSAEPRLTVGGGGSTAAHSICWPANNGENDNYSPIFKNNL